MKNYASKWFYDKDLGVVVYGNTKHLIGVDSYNSRVMSSSRGDFGLISIK